MKNLVNRKIAAIISRSRILNSDVVKAQLEIANQNDVRLDEHLLDTAQITEAQRMQIFLRYMDWREINIDVIGYDVETVKKVTSAFVDKHNCIPLTQEDRNGLLYTYIAIVDPFNLEAIKICRAIFENHCKFVIATSSKIHRIKNIVFSNVKLAEAIEESIEDTDQKKTKKIDENELEGMDILNAPAVKLAESLLRGGIASGASDIHIEPYESHVRVRYRIDGVLSESTTFDIKIYPAVLTRIKILAAINIAERRIPQDGRIKQTYNDVDYDFRVSTLPTVHGEKIVIRILDTTSFNFTREQIGFLEADNGKIDDLINKPYGIVLLTGPTGCGKSTTLYSFIKEVNNENVNVITVEDPVEYTIDGVNQVQVNVKANMTFANALRSILRQDPNIIMIGEIRDEETAEIAIRMAITGHLVFSTIHTNDAPGAVTRLLDLGIEPYFVTDALNGVIAQRLVRRLCPDCKKAYTSSKSENQILGLQRSRTLYKPVGCPACHNTGYRGRTGVHEVLVLDNEIKDLVMKKASTDEIRKKAIEKGMLELKDTCREKVLQGVTSVAELITLLYTKEV